MASIQPLVDGNGSQRNGLTPRATDSQSRAPTYGDVTASVSGDASLKATSSQAASPPPGQSLTGKQEHYLKRELLGEQAKWEISELNSPTALRRFGAPFRSDLGDVSPLDSSLPILRYIFVHHVREFPFLDKAKEKEFWQDKLQVFLESFATKNISSSEDRLEETKRRKLALKAQKLVELMMVSGVRTSSGFEERIRFTELEIIDRDAIDTGVPGSTPEGNFVNGWDVNVAGVRVTSVKRNIRYHQHAVCYEICVNKKLTRFSRILADLFQQEFIVQVKRKGELDRFVARRYGDFGRLFKALRIELPGRVLPPMPRKNKTSTTSSIISGIMGSNDSDIDSISSASTLTTPTGQGLSGVSESLKSLTIREHRRAGSASSGKASPQPFPDSTLSASPATANGKYAKQTENVVLWRENQRISLRAFLRSLVQNPQIAQTKALQDFFNQDPITLCDEDVLDISRRAEVDKKRAEEQRKFYEIARKRAADLDVYMEEFRQDIVERNGLTMLFMEIKEKNRIQDLSIQYQKFAEWLRIEVAATIYHLFLAEDNSPELFAQAKRIHSLIPYTLIKNVIRVANPAAVMSGVLDIFLAQPFGTRSLMQRIFSLTLNDGIRNYQKSIDSLAVKIDDPVFVAKLKSYSDADQVVKDIIRDESIQEDIDLIVGILRSELIEPGLEPEQVGRLYNAYVAFNAAVENVDEELKQGAQLFSYLKQLMKLYTRQRDKTMMLNLIEEPVTLSLFRDLFTIFYEPLVRVYKSANVYSSVTDFSAFVDDMMQVVEKCREQDASADPNQTVQAFIDLCQRHEHNFYKFVHEVHTHDNGLFTQLMGWIEGILDFLRKGPKAGTLDVNALFEGSVSLGIIDKDKAIAEINSLVAWQEARKKWHQDKTRQKMAAEGGGAGDLLGDNALSVPVGFSVGDFGLNAADLQEMAYDDLDESDEEAAREEEDDLDPIEAERRRRSKRQDRLRRTAGEPAKPPVSEIYKLNENFLTMLRAILAE